MTPWLTGSLTILAFNRVEWSKPLDSELQAPTNCQIMLELYS